VNTPVQLELALPLPKALKLDTRPLEKEIESKVCKYAVARGFYVRKFVSPAHRSVPDRYLIAPGRPDNTPRELANSLGARLFKIEFKRPGEKATPNQEREHQELNGFGVPVYVIDNVLGGKALIDEYTHWWMK
jgi:hypothetical protein